MRHNFHVCWAYFQASRKDRIKIVFVEGTYSPSRILDALKLALAEILDFCPVISPLCQPHKYSEVTEHDFSFPALSSVLFVFFESLFKVVYCIIDALHY